MQYDLTGKVDVSLNGVTIPAAFLSGDDGVVTTITETVREIQTMSGTVRQSTGTYDEAMVAFSVVLPNMNYLENIFPDMYEPSVDRPTVAGRTAFGGDDCINRENTPLVVHYTCQANSDNDIYVPNGSVTASVEVTQNREDPVVVEITVQAQPDTDGVYVYMGTGDLDEPTLWNAATGEYEPVGSS